MFVERPRPSRRGLRACAALMLSLCTWAATAPVQAQEFPSKPIRLVVGYPPGGSNDIVARIIAPRLGEVLGTQVVVENRAGANGIIGADAVAKAPPDGYTLLAASASPLVITPHTLPRVPFHTLTDLVPVNTVGLTPEAIAVLPSLGISTLKELLALARTRQISLASSGNGGLPHLTIELLMQQAKSNIVHVPYKGAGPAVTDTLAGHVSGIVMDMPPLYPLIQDGRLKALAVTSAKRVEFLPAVPTAQEELPGFDVANWVGVFAPARTPRVVVDRINAGLQQVLARPDVREQLLKVAVVPSILASPDAFARFVAQEHARWGQLIKEKNIVSTE